MEFVKEAGRMPDPTMGLIQTGYSGKGKPLDEMLQPLDWEIIHALSWDSRKAVSKVAEEVGYSKTVHRRLSLLIDEGLIEFSSEWFPSASNDIMTTIHVEAGLASPEEVLERLTARASGIAHPRGIHQPLFSVYPKCGHGFGRHSRWLQSRSGESSRSSTNTPIESG